MKILTTAIAAALAVSTLAATPADAQRWRHHGWDRGGGRWHGGYHYRGGYGYGYGYGHRWRRHRICGWGWHHHWRCFWR